MGMTVPKVEIGFDLTDQPSAPFFRLDDDVQGRLDNTEYRLGGTLFYDVTDRVRSIDFGRGREDTFAVFPAGQLDVDLNNHDRAFDPLYSASPFAGNIVPQREVRVSVNGEIQFTGFVDDWDLSYTNDGDSTASLKATEGIARLNRRVLEGFTPSQETAGERINTVLDRSEVRWPDSLRDIDVNSQQMGAYAVEPETSALEYLQNISLSEPGSLFQSKDGKVVFRNRQTAPSLASLVTFSPTDVPFDNLRILYGSELLFNRIVINRYTGGTVTVEDKVSVDTYGVSDLTIEDSQVATDQQIVDVALGYAGLYSQPEYRVEGFDVYLHKLDSVTQDQVLALDIGSVVLVEFTPNHIGDPISQYGEIIRMSHIVTPEIHTVTFGLAELRYQPLVLDDAVFGKLDVGTLSW